jgi:hypothetical protein
MRYAVLNCTGQASPQNVRKALDAISKCLCSGDVYTIAEAHGFLHDLQAMQPDEPSSVDVVTVSRDVVLIAVAIAVSDPNDENFVKAARLIGLFILQDGLKGIAQGLEMLKCIRDSKTRR